MPHKYSDTYGNVAWLFIFVKMKINERSKDLKLREAYEIIKKCPYLFSKEEIDFDISDLCDGRMTCAMYYIECWKTLPPKAILHNPALQDSRGMTLAMYWICYTYTLPPPEIRHDTSIQNLEGSTCAMLWIRYKRTLPPIELRHDPKIQDVYGQTCATYWRLIKTNKLSPYIRFFKGFEHPLHIAKEDEYFNYYTPYVAQEDYPLDTTQEEDSWIFDDEKAEAEQEEEKTRQLISSLMRKRKGSRYSRRRNNFTNKK